MHLKLLGYFSFVFNPVLKFRKGVLSSCYSLIDNGLGYFKHVSHFNRHKTQCPFSNFGKQGYLLCTFLMFIMVSIYLSKQFFNDFVTLFSFKALSKMRFFFLPLSFFLQCWLAFFFFKYKILCNIHVEL